MSCMYYLRLTYYSLFSHSQAFSPFQKIFICLGISYVAFVSSSCITIFLVFNNQLAKYLQPKLFTLTDLFRDFPFNFGFRKSKMYGCKNLILCKNTNTFRPVTSVQRIFLCFKDSNKFSTVILALLRTVTILITHFRFQNCHLSH